MMRRWLMDESELGFTVIHIQHFAVAAILVRTGMSDRVTMNGGYQMALRTLDATLTSGRECEAEGVGSGKWGKPVSPKRNSNGQRSD